MGEKAAGISTLLLATSAGWIVFSGFCVTDVPMSVFFSIAVLLTLRLLRGAQPWWIWFGMGASLGLAALAKGLVPVVLALPLAWFLRRQWHSWWLIVAGVLLVAGPWYALVFARHGFAFVQVFFLQQQVSRLYSGTLQHVQPVYFYLPVLLGGLFPWTPLLFVLRPREWRGDMRLLCLAAVAGFGFLFFSVSLNKLPGYILPLLPPLFGLIGVAAAKSEVLQNRAILISCGGLIALIPIVGQMLPTLMTNRISSSREIFLAILPITSAMLVLFIVPPLVAWFAHRAVAWLLLVACCSISIIQLKASVYPVLDQTASPRSFWREIHPEIDRVCDAGLHRAWAYGLAFYEGKPIPICDLAHRPLRLVQRGTQRAHVENSDKSKQ
jgi:4-amino-4-deoxy-L-arabinose transferase-like glycosyltransferase